MNSRRPSLAEDKRLLNVIQGLPVLYNHEEYGVVRNHDVLRDVWKQVAAAVKKDEESCKKRWRDIRDHYFKIKRNQQRGKNKTPKWMLYDMLSFLDNAKRKRRYAASEVNAQRTEAQEVSDPEDIMDIYEPETSVKVESDLVQDIQGDSPSLEYVSVPSPSSSPVYVDLQGPVPDKTEEDDVDVFMRSVAMTIKRFSPEVRAEAKLNILSVVTQLEFPNRLQ